MPEKKWRLLITFFSVCSGLLLGMMVGGFLFKTYLGRGGKTPLGGRLPGTPYPNQSPTMPLLSPSPLPSSSVTTTSVPMPAIASPTLSRPMFLPTLTPTLWPQGVPIVIGYSVKGRPITVYRFGDGSDQRLIIGGIHGGYEYNTVQLTQKFIRYLAAHSEIIPNEVSLFVLPVLNVDGYEDYPRLSYGRANAHGVDLNRNFDAHWAKVWNKEHCWHYQPITAGAYPFSEPETAALRDFLSQPDIHIRAIISYHSAGALVYAGGQPPTLASVELARLIAKITGYQFPPQDDQCEYTGQLIDWAAEHGIAAVDVELPTHRDVDFENQWKLLRYFVQWKPDVSNPAATPLNIP